MQQFKVINKLSEIDNTCNNADLLGNTFTRGLKEFNLVTINKTFNRSKTKGIACSVTFKTLFVLPFVGILNIWSLMQSGYSPLIDAKKDVFYTFLNNPLIDWRSIVFQFAKQFLSIVKTKSIDNVKAGVSCMILDDTLLGKSGKAIEFIGKVYDHCSHQYQLGMKALTLGFWDGISFIPLDFSIHNEPGKNNNRGLRAKDLKAQFTKSRPADSPIMQRIAEVSQCKITVGLAMIQKAILKKIVPQYILADSWFISDVFFKEINKIALITKHTLHVIGLMKANRKIELNGRVIKGELLPQLHHSKIKKCRKHRCNYIALKVTYKGTALKVFFVKMNGQQIWKMLVTTDATLSFMKAMACYQIRWSIEVFFKDAKQNLHLGKCQSTDFDAQIASISITFTNYIVLALTKRFENYETIGEMFRAFKDTMLQQNIMQRLWQLIHELVTSILEELGADVDLVIKKIINSDTFLEKINTTFNFQRIQEKQLNYV